MNAELGLKSIVRPKKPGYERGSPIKSLKINEIKNFMQTPSIRNSARTSPICFKKAMKYATTTQSSIRMTAVWLPALRTAISLTVLQSGR